VRFIVDAQLPPALTVWLRKAGHDADHVQDLGLQTASDSDIRSYAAQNGSVVFTKDRDFIPTTESSPRQVQVVWVRTGNVSTRSLLDRLEAAWPQLIDHLSKGERLVELR